MSLWLNSKIAEIQFVLPHLIAFWESFSNARLKYGVLFSSLMNILGAFIFPYNHRGISKWILSLIKNSSSVWVISTSRGRKKNPKGFSWAKQHLVPSTERNPGKYWYIFKKPQAWQFPCSFHSIPRKQMSHSNIIKDIINTGNTPAFCLAVVQQWSSAIHPCEHLLFVLTPWPLGC